MSSPFSLLNNLSLLENDDYISFSGLDESEAKTLLTAALDKLSDTGLRAVRQGLVSEKYVCTGKWVDAKTDEVHSTCLFGAAYLQTPEFKQELEEAACSYQQALNMLDDRLDRGQDFIPEALGITNTQMSNVIEGFDYLGHNSYHKFDTTENVTVKVKVDDLVYESDMTVINAAYREWLVDTIDEILNSR